MNLLKKLVRYQPKFPDKETRVTYEVNDTLVELYHAESECYFHIPISELPVIIKVLEEIYKVAKTKDEPSTTNASEK